jgi:Protein of unknown function (DUF2510)
MDVENSGNPFRPASARAESDIGAPTEADFRSWLGEVRDAVNDARGRERPSTPEPVRLQPGPAQTTAGSEPDWYPDPTGIYAERYWDGTTWTESVIDRDRVTSAHRATDQHPPPSTLSSANAAIVERLIDDYRGTAGGAEGSSQFAVSSRDTWTTRVADPAGTTMEEPSATGSVAAVASVADPPTAATTLPDAAEPSESAKPFRERVKSRIRSMRNFWVISTLVFVVLTGGYLLLPVNESAVNIDGTRTISVKCGSVVSPRAPATHGSPANESSICDTARQPNETRAIFFGILAAVSMLLAGFATWTKSPLEERAGEKQSSEEEDHS